MSSQHLVIPIALAQGEESDYGSELDEASLDAIYSLTRDCSSMTLTSTSSAPPQHDPTMATTHPPQNPTASLDESDYGSDLDEATVDALFARDIEQPVILDDHGDMRQPVIRLARVHHSKPLNAAAWLAATGDEATPSARCEPAVEIEYDEGRRRGFTPPPAEDANTTPRPRRRTSDRAALSPFVDAPPDTRAPLQRFRCHKPLSVTDLVSPAWCELQYFYSLSRFGRVRPTRAMKQGSSVHKVLEEQVHTEVRVEVVSKEDRFALRLWNVVQGLRTLRQTGMTRELEVWGVVGEEEGDVVNGVIDQVTTVCPDVEAEERMLEAEAAGTAEKNGAKKKTPALPPDQRTLGQYFANSTFGGTTLERSSTLERNGSAWLGTLQDEKPAYKNLYIVDVKTRQSRSLPAHGSQTRPTHYQLMLYSRLFSDLAANAVNADRVFARYGLDASAAFSDTFLAQMAGLGMGGEDHEVGEAGTWMEVEVLPLEVLLARNTLTKLWGYMVEEFARTVGAGLAAVSPFLTAEFRSGSAGALLGRRHFAFDAGVVDTYVRDELAWWRGEREARGVEVEEAYKCGFCEFAEGCEWRLGKVEEGVENMRVRKEAKGRSGLG